MKFLAGFIIFFSISLFGVSQPVSPFNELKVQTDSLGNYKFLVSGHFYGDRNNKSHFPANTLLANLDWINESEADMLICLGDIFMDVRNDIPNYEKSFFDKLEIPLYNAVGNHDLTDNIYQEHYGATYFTFELNGDIHIILDTEKDNGDIKGEQLELIKSAEKKVREKNINNVFIYAHRTVWKDTYTEMEGLFTDNTQSITTPNFESDVYPILKQIGQKAKVFWFSGSLGPAPASFFHYPDEENNIIIIGTSIRSHPRDAMLMVKIHDGEVRFETHSLTGEELKPLEEYNVELWKSSVGEEPFNWRLVPYYIQLMLTHRYFWYGMGFALTFMFIIYWIRKRRQLR